MAPYIILIFLCEILLVSFACYLIFSFINKTPFYPSSIKQLDLLKKSNLINFDKYKSFVDIGSGDGRIVRWATKQGFDLSHGIEYNPYLTLYSRLRNMGNAKTKIYNSNFINHNFAEYDFAYLYIFPEFMDKIKDKLFTEMKPGSVIVTNTFKFSEIEPSERFEKLYIYYIK